jgi:hypothetical protein
MDFRWLSLHLSPSSATPTDQCCVAPKQ